MNSHISTDKKLQLIRRIRQEHQTNRNTIRGREAFLYGKSGVSYEAFQDPEMADLLPETDLPVSTFRFRTAAALLLFAFLYLASSKDETILGIAPSQIHEAVEKDYSAILFDFMNEIPYTLHEAEESAPVSVRD